MRDEVHQGTYTLEIKEIRECTIGKSHGRLSESWCQVPEV
jgi:hypothetical protein